MLTIPNAVEEVIKKKPFLEGALVEGLVNLSALARQLKPEIEKKVGKEVNDSAVIMAHIVIVLVLFFILYLPQHILKHIRAVHTSHMSQPWL